MLESAKALHFTRAMSVPSKPSESEISHLSLNIETPKNSKLIASLSFFSYAASVTVTLIGCVVLLGWIFDIAILKSVLPGLGTMKFNTALCFVLGGSSLWLWHQGRATGSHKQQLRPVKPLPLNLNSHRLAQGFAILVILISLLTLIQYGFGVNLGIDQLLFQQKTGIIGNEAPGRMAPNTALDFLLLGSGLLLLTKKVYRPAQSFGIIAFLVAFLGLLGYLYGFSSFYKVGSYTTMALHTAIAFILLAAGLLSARPDRGLMSVITSDSAGGVMARRLAPAVIGIPPVLGWLVLLGKRSHLYHEDIGIAFLCILYIVFLATLVWWNARTLGVADYQALHDLLTGLPNRILFNQRLSVSLLKARRQNSVLAVMFLDLDRFKKINDALGHDVGDELLKAVAIRLRDCLQKNQTLARWGGDEFTLLLPQVIGTEDCANVAQHILDVLQPPFLIGNHYFHISSSIGIALYRGDGEDPETLIKNADVALYSAKEQGRKNYQFYTPTINEQASELLVLENRLHNALERGEFAIYYQPKVNIKTGKITGMEALLRWNCPSLGFVSPGKFIPLAEENGLILPIGEWVLQTACAQAKAWIEAGSPPIRVAVNLSVRQFQQPNLVKLVARCLEQAGLEPNYLELEITETITMQNVDLTRSILGQLDEMGVLISMDDFGTGYSSLSYLKNFPLHTLKIDRSFVRDLTVDPYDVAIASTVVALGRGLNMTVVAEGVETQEQLEKLRSLGCDEMQGYLFSKPLPPKDAIALIQRSTFSGNLLNSRAVH